MVFINYEFGCNKREARRLFRERLTIKERIRVNKKKGNTKKVLEWSLKLIPLEAKINKLVTKHTKQSGRRKSKHKLFIK